MVMILSLSFLKDKYLKDKYHQKPQQNNLENLTLSLSFSSLIEISLSL